MGWLWSHYATIYQFTNNEKIIMRYNQHELYSKYTTRSNMSHYVNIMQFDARVKWHVATSTLQYSEINGRRSSRKCRKMSNS